MGRTEEAKLKAVAAAAEGRETAERRLAERAAAAKAAGIPVDAIAAAAGFKTRRAVYLLLERHDLQT